MKSRHDTRWLDLAVKARQWAVDEQAQALKLAQSAARQAEAAHQQARHELDTALAGRSAVLARSHFASCELSDHGAYEGRLRVQLDGVARQMDDACTQEQSVRGQMLDSLAQRDALQRSLERAHTVRRDEEGRRSAREHDELWLLRSDASLEASHED